MAKSSKPTNAFGIDPNSFKAIPNKVIEEKPAPVPVQDIPAVTPVQEQIPAQEIVPKKTKRDPKRERKTCHIHFLLQESLLTKVDAYAEQIGKSRSVVIEKALKAYLLEHGE